MQDAKYPKILQELYDNISIMLIQESIDSKKAHEVAHYVTENIRINWGGDMIYFSKGLVYRLSKRDREIWRIFDGRNHHELIKKYDISLQRLYKIIKIQRRKDLLERQGDLFDGGDDDE